MGPDRQRPAILGTNSGRSTPCCVRSVAQCLPAGGPWRLRRHDQSLPAAGVDHLLGHGRNRARSTRDVRALQHVEVAATWLGQRPIARSATLSSLNVSLPPDAPVATPVSARFPAPHPRAVCARAAVTRLSACAAVDPLVALDAGSSPGLGLPVRSLLPDQLDRILGGAGHVDFGWICRASSRWQIRHSARRRHRSAAHRSADRPHRRRGPPRCAHPICAARANGRDTPCRGSCRSALSTSPSLKVGIDHLEAPQRGFAGGDW